MTEEEPKIETEEMESAPASPKQVMITDEELRTLQRESLEYKDKYLRQLADTENARKRFIREREEMVKLAAENFIVEFLPPLDNLEKALGYAQVASDEVKNWAFGFQMILTQFKDALSNNGVEAIPSLGMPFDPHHHEAVEVVVTTTHPPGVIVEECIRGYKIGERTIRPARVKVSQAPADEASESNLNE